jgi:hypothetical protein
VSWNTLPPDEDGSTVDTLDVCDLDLDVCAMCASWWMAWQYSRLSLLLLVIFSDTYEAFDTAAMASKRHCN